MNRFFQDEQSLVNSEEDLFQQCLFECEWFRYFSLWPGPKRVLQRSEVTFLDSRAPEGPEQMSLYPEHVVLSCSTPTGPIELAMSPSSLMGFQSWLESGPPGTDWTRGPRR